MAHENTFGTGEAGNTTLGRRIVAALTTYGERAGNALVYSSAYLAAVAMVETALAMYLLSIPPNPAPLVVALVTFSVYTYDRILDADTDELSNPDQAAFVRKHSDVLYVLAAVSYAVALTAAVLWGPLALGLTLLPGLFAVFYASDWLPNLGGRFERLKQILVVNTAVVAFAWSVTLVFLPVAFAGRMLSVTGALVFALFFLRTFVDAELPNVRDIESDRAVGVSTIPTVFGVRRTRHALYALDLLTLGLVLYALAESLFPVVAVAALVAAVCYSLCLTSRLGRIDDVEPLVVGRNLEYLFAAALVVVLSVV